MDSPVGFLMMLLLAGSLVFQLFFRYDHWTGGAHRDVSFERDNLTGEVHQIKPGQRVDFMARLLGKSHWGEKGSRYSRLSQEEALSEENAGLGDKEERNRDLDEAGLDWQDEGTSVNPNHRVSRRGQASEQDNKNDEDAVAMNMVASSTPLKGRSGLSQFSGLPVPSVTQNKKSNQHHDLWDAEDLNRDGSQEELIQTQSKAGSKDGLMDISVLSDGRELFYGRGKKLSVLPSRSNGWSDLLLTVSESERLRFRYNPKLDGYELGPSQ
jgi:hypothetical protein